MGRKPTDSKRENESLQTLQALGFILFILGFGIGIISVFGFLSSQVGDEVGEILPAAAEAADSPEVTNANPIVALVLVILGVVLIALGSKQRRS